MLNDTVDTSIAADERLAGDTPAAGSAPKAPTSFAAAGEAFLKTLSPDQQNAPITAGPDDDDTGAGDVADEGTGTELAAEAITRADGATWKPGLNRWVDASGAMVAGAAPEGAPAARPAAATAAAAAAVAPPKPVTIADPAAGSGAVEKITLPGLADRGEEPIELEIDDPAVAERLRRLANDGLRATAAREQRAALDADRARLTEVTSAIEDDPIGFVIGRMSPERQLDVARALILEHLDAILPDIDELTTTPGLRSDKRLELQRKMNTSATEAAQVREARAYATRIVGAIEALVPDDAEAQEGRDFVETSRAYLATLATRGQSITPDNVKTLLAKHLRIFGPAAVAPRPAGSTVAQPATAAARAVAARAPSIEEADRSAQRVRRVQTQRAAATRVAPAGAGAAPVTVPLLKPEERTDVRTASSALLKRGLPATWAPGSE